MTLSERGTPQSVKGQPTRATQYDKRTVAQHASPPTMIEMTAQELYVTYTHYSTPDGPRFRQLASDKLPKWANNIRVEKPVAKQMTPEELIAKKPTTRTFGLLEWSIQAAAMLRQQAEQIEALIKERDDAYVQSLQFSEENKALLKANLDCVDHFNTLKVDYDALKADAERFVTLSECVISSDLTHDIGVAESVDEMRSAIDAMKEKS